MVILDEMEKLLEGDIDPEGEDLEIIEYDECP